jgi:redox-sensitive bicupin YhaK (pirin superfamily)
MITVRRSTERHHDRRHAREAWLTFHPLDRADRLADGFGALETLDEERLPPGSGIPRFPHRDTEIITYVREGALAFQDSTGGSGAVQAGQFQRVSAADGPRHRESNASRTEWAHLVRIWLRPAEAGLEPGHEERRFSAAERRDHPCLVASTDGRRGSLRVRQDVLVHAALLDPGQHLVHELAPGRRAWLHLVQGQVVLGDLILATGDGAGITDERAVSLTALEATELLLVDLGAAPESASA